MLVRIEFAKGEQARFLSHLDLLRSFQRIFRRSGLPVAYSQGFNPHPKMAFSPALPVGTTSDREYMDVELLGEISPQEVLARLQGQLPPGLSMLRAVVVKDAAVASLDNAVDRASYVVRGEFNMDKDQVEHCLDKIMSRDKIMVEKRTKRGMKLRDIRPGIYGLEYRTDAQGAYLWMLLAAGSGGTVRPDALLQVLAGECAVSINCMDIRREGLYIYSGGEYCTPLEAVN